MDFSLLYRKLILMVSQPSKFWSQVKDEKRPIGEIRKSFLLPILIMIFVSSFAGTYLFTYNTLSIIYPLLKGLEYFLIFLVTIEIVVLLLGEISGFLLKVKISDVIYKLVTYSLAPFMVIMIVTRLFSSLLFVNTLGFYGLFILWKGIDIILGGDLNFRIRFFALSSTSIVVFYLGIRWIFDTLVEGFYLTIFG